MSNNIFTRKSRKKDKPKNYFGNFNKTLTFGKKPQKNPLKKGVLNSH